MHNGDATRLPLLNGEAPPALKVEPPPDDDAPVLTALVGLLADLSRRGKSLRLSLEYGDWSAEVTVARSCPDRAADANVGRSSTECERDILIVLVKTGRRLTGDEIKQALEDGGMIHGESTVGHALAKMVGDGVLSNARDGMGRGYYCGANVGRPPGDCSRDILAVLAEADRRLTGDEIRKALDKKNLIHGDSTVSLALARMVKTGVLSNARDGRGSGYGLADDCDEKLSPAHRDVLRAVADAQPTRLTAEEIARLTKYPADPHLRKILSSLRGRGLLTGERGEPGYSLTEAGREALADG